MSRNRILLLASTLALALIGMLIVQVFWLKNASRLESDVFEMNTTTLLEKAVKTVEDNYYCFSLYAEKHIPKNGHFFIVNPNLDDSNHQDTVTLNAWSAYLGDTLYSSPNLSFGAPARAEIQINFEYEIDSVMVSQEGDNKLEKFIASVSDDYYYYQGKRIVDTVNLNEELSARFSEFNPDLKYYYSVHFQGVDTPLFSSLPPNSNLPPDISTVMNEDLQLLNNLDVKIYFPNRENLLVKGNLSIILAAAALFILIMGLFIFIIRTILHQKRLSNMKNELINNMTHEFNTPVTNIKLATGSYREDISEERKKFIIDVVKEENTRIEKNIKTVINLSLAEDEDMMSLERTHLNPIIQQLPQHYQLHLANINAKLKVDLHAENDEVNVNETAIQQVFTNLIDNALKYCNGSPNVELRTYNQRNKYVVEVKDNGKGIKKENLPHIFNKFFRGSNGNSENASGFGLGLYYVKKVLDLHKGEIDVESQAGKGSLFRVELPLN